MLSETQEKEFIAICKENHLVAADYLEDLDDPYLTQLASRMRRPGGHMVLDFILRKGRIRFSCRECGRGKGNLFKLGSRYRIEYRYVWSCFDCMVFNRKLYDLILTEN